MGIIDDQRDRAIIDQAHFHESSKNSYLHGFDLSLYSCYLFLQ